MALMVFPSSASLNLKNLKNKHESIIENDWDLEISIIR